MQHHDALAALDEVAEVLLAVLIQVAREIVHDQNVILAAKIALESRGAGRHRHRGQIVVTVEQRVKRGHMVMPSSDHQSPDGAGQLAGSLPSAASPPAAASLLAPAKRLETPRPRRGRLLARAP